MDERYMPKNHRVSINRRETGNISGVLEVVSFDTAQIVLNTEEGGLMIKGNGLHVTKLTLEKGEIEIDGHIDSLIYTDKKAEDKSQEGLFGRLFR